MKTRYLKIIWLVATSSTIGFSQTPKGYFGIRGGYQRVATDVHIYSFGNTGITKGYAPRNTVYGGVFYQHSLGRYFLYRAELNYQQKGLEHRDQDGKVTYQQRLHYAGLTPLIGISPIANLSLLVGPEANWLVKKSDPIQNPTTRPIEVGLTARVAYRYKWIGLEVGYFRAGNAYDNQFSQFAEGKLKNRTWQAGLILFPGKFRND